MKANQAIGIILFFIVFLGGIYMLYNDGNNAIFLGKTTKVNAQIDSIIPVRGLKARGWNQLVYFNFKYNNTNYKSQFKNTASRWKVIDLNDSLQLKISIKEPKNNKVIGAYYSNK